MPRRKPSSSADNPDALAVIERLNKRHAVVMEGGRTIVITEELDPALGRIVLRRSSFSDIRNFYRNELVNIGSGDKVELRPAGEYWLGHRMRRQFDGVTFQPGVETPRYFNLWRGFSCSAAPGDWSLMRAHIKSVICRGSEDLFQWLLAWMAAAVQLLDRAAEICVVLRGSQGSGKGIVARSFGSLFGQHFVHVSNLRHLVGNFNAHLHDAVFLFADEISWIGDRQGEGVLKMLVTEPFIPIERKGRDLVTVKNHLHIMVASNHDWVVPAGFDDRRFLVLDLSDEHAQDAGYFGAILDQLEAGGRAAMLHDLLRHDLSGVDLRRAPLTEALQEQKRLSMTPQQRWWLDKLTDGRLLPFHDDWQSEVICEALQADYAETLKNLGVRSGATPTELGIGLKKLAPSGYPGKFQRVVELLEPYQGKQRKWHWRFPSLSECRAHFDHLTRSQHAWPDPDLAEGREP
jgi:hypothetical protein